jgi:hypothetical protein
VSNRRFVSARVTLLAIVGGVSVGAPRSALADGAFPDEIQVFVPTDQPSDIIVAANFGLIESTNNGQSWLYVCEAQAGASGNVSLYQMGPTDTLLADSFSGLFRSSDLACSWTQSGGALAGNAYVWDAAFDPNAPGYVLALSNVPDAGGASAIYPSTDDGVTFGPPLYTTPANMTGIELSVSSPGLVYVTGNEPATDGGVTYYGNAFVLVGYDGGASWGTPIDHPELNAELAGDAGPDAGPPDPPLIALAQVDPVDPQTAYFTLTLPNSNAYFLAVTHDGGKTLQILFQAPEPMSAFLRSSEGILYVGTRDLTGQGGLFEAPLDGGPFQVVHQACADGGIPDSGSCDLWVRALSERNGELYACGYNWAPNDMALGDSSDHGVHFTSLMQFVDISALGCPGTSIEATCGPTWVALQLLFGIDAGSPAPDAGTVVPPSSGSCGGCGTAEGGAALLALLALFAVRRKRSA